jgi:hypothetical protein
MTSGKEKAQLRSEKDGMQPAVIALTEHPMWGNQVEQETMD